MPNKSRADAPRIGARLGAYLALAAMIFGYLAVTCLFLIVAIWA